MQSCLKHYSVMEKLSYRICCLPYASFLLLFILEPSTFIANNWNETWYFTIVRYCCAAIFFKYLTNSSGSFSLETENDCFMPIIPAASGLRRRPDVSHSTCQAWYRVESDQAAVPGLWHLRCEKANISNVLMVNTDFVPRRWWMAILGYVNVIEHCDYWSFLVYYCNNWVR